MATFNKQGFITELNLNDVFVFGSNLQGEHAGGAARQAYQSFGAIWGLGVGIQGQSYAIPTMEIGIETIAVYIKQFIDYATITPNKTYYVTPIGTGIAGYSQQEMGDIWSRYELPYNVNLL